jgi:NAD+ diphosphatase
MIERVKNKEFISGIVPPADRKGQVLWFAIQGNNLLVSKESSSITIPALKDFSEIGLPSLSQNYLGLLEDRPCYAVELPEDVTPPTNMVFEGLRQVYGRLDEDLFWIAARAIQIVDWDRTHKYCGRCGVPMELQKIERAKKCPRCGLLYFPRLAPAIIVAIERGDKLLMGRSRRFATGVYSVLAGFVEPGESLEETVIREVKEEVGISIKNIQYFGSQPWPFPHSLMIGFTATYAGGEISIDETELEDAGWFTVDNLPPLPGKISIARKLIDSFIAKHGKLPKDD